MRWEGLVYCGCCSSQKIAKGSWLGSRVLEEGAGLIFQSWGRGVNAYRSWCSRFGRCKRIVAELWEPKSYFRPSVVLRGYLEMCVFL